ncbi:MAG: helix-turn-helix domain-containing protein, partial [Actinoallomurus sp.]
MGAQLRRLREAAGVTRHAAGASIGVGESKLGRIEVGRVGLE